MHLLKQPQLFVRVGRNRYVPVERPWPGYDLYVWDDELQRIVPQRTTDSR